MHKLIAVLMFAAAVGQAQTAKDVTVCWTPEGGTQTCHVFRAGTVTMVTLDLRQAPAENIVVQPLPAYMMKALQTYVDGQVYRMPQADGTIVVKQRYASVQDLLMRFILRSMAVPVAKLFPPTGDDAGKTTFDAMRADLLSAMTVVPIQ